MKNVLILAIVILTLISCRNNSIPDGKETSKPLSSENIATKDTIINFEGNESGKLPDGFTQTATGETQALNWKVETNLRNKSVAQLAKNDDDHYNLLILNKPSYKNLIMSVKTKAIAGYQDQGGGLVWRYIDNNNYYMARYNPLENNFRLYHVVKGNRVKMKSININIKSGEWFTMKVEMNGNKISCSLNDKVMIQTNDDTFTKAGRVGFWTKADAQSYFDDLNIRPLY
ncbi:hypothetical protein IRZ71_21580 [Flavobacterium sp. ANB]|uniref:family 16 glycoside hydrolase n=1 Tax=unclassified Flavobacterium TaxID=196869 RepID=UPI0012B72B1C|nr:MULTISPECIES: family 16 glycoside hydrolase [unclassified Flavobacterium]MBF4518956.1 hypothetical protein [Flavobacterium sp. ANB]MTD71566.1 hypothetical protein [Flavobacterium sp. LC2016-13]